MGNHFPVELDYLVRRVTRKGWEIKPRIIPNYELVWIVKGRGQIVIQERTTTVAAGDLICFRPGVLHSLAALDEPYMEFYGVHFTPPPETDDLPIPNVMHLEAPYRIEALFRELYEAHSQKTYFYQWRQNVVLEQILCELMETAEQKKAPAEAMRIRRVLAYIHEEPCRAFSLEELLRQAGVQKTVFLQSFRRVTGMTPKRYVLALRMAYARELLLETDLSVAAIAEKCGFDDAFYFSRCFRQHFAASPRQYKKEYEEKRP